jgi:hypothetical protein
MNAIRKRPKLRKTVATGLFIFGVVALALPLLPGWIMIGLGLYFLSIDSPVMQGHIARYRAKFRYLDHALRHSYDRFNQEPKAPVVPAIGEKA